MQGPNMQHQALLDTVVLTEKGARFELLELVTQVWTPVLLYIKIKDDLLAFDI